MCGNVAFLTAGTRGIVCVINYKLQKKVLKVANNHKKDA